MLRGANFFARQAFKCQNRSAGINFARMTTSMNVAQFSQLSCQLRLVQISQMRMMSTNLLLANIQMNQLLTNEEAESDQLVKSSEDADEEDGSCSNVLATIASSDTV